MTPKKTNKKTTIAETFEDKRFSPHTAAKRSQAWFIAKAQELRGVTPGRIMSDPSLTKKNNIEPGSMYLYYYDPKFKDTLPVYDTFPLVIPFKTVSGGFLGLNLHFLPPATRVRLLDKLLVFASNDKLDAKTKLKFSWEMVSQASKFRNVEPCVKMYLTSHVQSKYIKIDPRDWALVCSLNLDRFKKKTAITVWKDYL